MPIDIQVSHLPGRDNPKREIATNSEYQDFLLSKHLVIPKSGFDVEPEALNENLFDFQRDIVLWALQLGRSAIFANVGLGKTLMQLSWAEMVSQYTGKPVLIITPLAVAAQTVREGVKFGIETVYRKDETRITAQDKIVITNYERLDKFQNFIQSIDGVVLDESGILKNYSGKTKNQLERMFANMPYKLCCSATPAPNDYIEIGNHSQFLNVLESGQMLTRWFTHDRSDSRVFRLKGHAEADFWKWVTSWAVCITKPSDLGDKYAHEDKLYELPPLNIIGHYVSANKQAIQEAWSNGQLLPNVAPSSMMLGKVKRTSMPERLEMAKEIVTNIPDNEQILIWCMLNDEADALRKLFPEAIEVRGNETTDAKERKLEGFTNGEIRILITKGKIAGHGLNWQQCYHVIDFSPNFSFETFYQQKGRNHRFGQLHPVNYNIVYAETEGNVIQILYRKQAQFEEMQTKMAQSMKKDGLFRDETNYNLTPEQNDVYKGKGFILYLGDCITGVAKLPDNSVHFSIYSPPFSNLYQYTDSMADMGNAEDDAEFFEHYRYLVRDKLRVTMPGRLTAVHTKDRSLYKSSSGWFGISPFSDDVVRLHREEGWMFHSRILIWKSPVQEMEQTDAHGLLHKNFVQRAQVLRVGMPDYLLVFVKPDPDGMGVDVEHNPFEIVDYIGNNPPAQWEAERRNKKAKFYRGSLEQYNNSIAVWQRYASPVWFDIDQTNVLNYRVAKEAQDDKHICPLQLDVAGRAIQLWTNRGETILTPFTGIGSEIVSALHLGREAIGYELKKAYFDYAVKYSDEAARAANQKTLWDLLPETDESIAGD